MSASTLTHRVDKSVEHSAISHTELGISILLKKTPVRQTNGVSLKSNKISIRLINWIYTAFDLSFIIGHNYVVPNSQARSQKSAMGGLFGGSGGLGAKPKKCKALENFAFFCKNNVILGLF